MCTDHGHYLGEHDLFGKPAAPVYSELGRIPLLVRWPGRRPGEIGALTTSVDLHATIADVFGAEVGHPTHGTSLLPLIEGTARSRCASSPCSATGDATSGSPTAAAATYAAAATRTCRCRCGRTGGRPCPCRRSPNCGCPGPTTAPNSAPCRVRRCRSSSSRSARGTRSPSGRSGRRPSETLLFDTSIDPGELEDRSGGREESELVDGLAAALHAIEAPDDLLARLGLA